MADQVPASPFDKPLNADDLRDQIGSDLPKLKDEAAPPREIPAVSFSLSAYHPGPRKLLWGTSFARGKLTTFGGTSGVTKSTYSITTALAMASNRMLLGDGPKEDEPLNVGYISTEDEVADLHRVARAAMQVHNITDADIGERLHLAGDDIFENFELIVEIEKELKINKAEFQFLEDFIDTAQLDVLFIDPLFGATGGVELTPQAMNLISRRLSKLARKKDVAICLVHHTRKTQRMNGQADAEDLSGGKTLMNTSRVVLMASRISKAEAEKFQVSSMADRLIKVVDAKTNLGPHGRKRYYQVFGEVVEDDNGRYEVQAVKEWLPPDVTKGIHPEIWDELKMVLERDFVLFAKTSNAGAMKLEAVIKDIATRLGLAHDTDGMAQELRETRRVVAEMQVNPTSGSRKKVQRAVIGDGPVLIDEEALDEIL